MNSVLVDPPAPEQLHLHFAQAARNAASDIKSFAQIMEDSRTKEVLERAKESKARNAEDITNWLVTEHKDWLDVKDDQLGDALDLGGDVGAAVSGAEITVEGMQSILEKFRESHLGVEVSLEESSRTIKVRRWHEDLRSCIDDIRCISRHRPTYISKSSLHPRTKVKVATRLRARKRRNCTWLFWKQWLHGHDQMTWNYFLYVFYSDCKVLLTCFRTCWLRMQTSSLDPVPDVLVF